MRTPATRKIRRTPVKEVAIHMQVAAFLRRAWPEHLPVYHCPNGEQRDARTAGKLKGMGVLAGVPDFTLHLPKGQVAYIEIKAASGQLSEAQIEFRAKVMALGCGYETCRSVDDVAAVVERWLALFGLTPRARLMTPAPVAPLTLTAPQAPRSVRP